MLLLLASLFAWASLSRAQTRDGQPHSPVDVTRYGARGDGSDDTHAIQAAIDAACSPGPGGGGVVFFPAPAKGANGFYAVMQKQTPSTAAIFDLSKCRGGVTLEGDASVNGAVLQFARNPMTRIIALSGAHPNHGAVFFWSGNVAGPTFRNLSITGWNRAIELQNGNNVTLDNVALSAQNTQAGWGCAGAVPHADCGDNVPLAIYNSIWIYADQLALVAPATYGYKVNRAQRTSGVVTLETENQDPPLGRGTKINLRNCASSSESGNFNGGPYSVQESTATEIKIQLAGPDGSCDGGAITSVEYGLLAAGIPATDGSTPGVSLFRVDKSIFAGGGIWYDQRTATPGATGSFYFYNVDQEGNSQSPFLRVTATSPGQLQTFGPLHVVDSQAFDCSDQAFISLDANRQARFNPIELVNSSGCTSRGKGIVELLGGQLGEVSIEGVADAGISRFPLDEKGGILRSVVRNENGFDWVVNTVDPDRLRSDMALRAGFGNSGDGAAIRMAAEGATQASLALDPDGKDGGLLFGDGHESGYDTRISHPDDLTTALDFAMAMPPAVVTLAPATGGSLPPGTYYSQVCAYTAEGGRRLSAPSAESAVSLRNGESALRIEWPAAKGLAVDGYVVFVCSGRPGCEMGGGASTFVVPGGGKTSISITSMQSSHGSPPAWNTTLSAVHVFQGRKLGLNNTSPQAQLDIAQQDAATPGFNIRSAASSVSNPWQVSDSNSRVKASIDGKFDLAVAGHHDQFAANGDTAGIITARNGEATTKKFVTPFDAAPVCTVTPLADPMGGTWWITATAGGLSLHLSARRTSEASSEPRSSERMSLQFSYICMGNPK